jgi:hypothetical protein
MTTPMMQRKSVKALAAVFPVVMLPLFIWLWIDFVHQTHARAVAREWGAAIKQSEKLPPGIGRAEDMLSRFKRIDLGYAPDDVKQAIHDYIAAFQQSVDAAKAGKDTSIPDKAMEEARLRMVSAIKRYE